METPPAVRTVTPRVSRRAWADPAVRTWWLLAVAVALAVAAYAASQGVERATENRLIRDGVPVQATVMGNSQKATPGMAIVADQEDVTVEFPWKGSPARPLGHLTRNATIGEVVSLHVDPADVTQWTDRTEPTPLLTRLFVGVAILPVVPVLFAVAWVIRRRVLKTYAAGTPAVATVAGRGQSPVAPMSYAVRCSVNDSADRTIHTVFVPRRAVPRPPIKGDGIDVIVPAGGGRPVAAAWFE